MHVTQLQYPVPISKRKLSPIYPTAHQSTHFAIGLPHSEFKTNSEYLSRYGNALSKQSESIDSTNPHFYENSFHLKEDAKFSQPRNVETPSFKMLERENKSNSPLPIYPKKSKFSTTIDKIQMPLRNSAIVESKTSMTPSKFGANLYKMHYDGSLESRAKQALLAKDIKQLQEIKEITKHINEDKQQMENSRIDKQSKEMQLRKEYQSIQYTKVKVFPSTKKNRYYFTSGCCSTTKTKSITLRHFSMTH